MSLNNQVIALAGMFQAAYLVRCIAREGKVDEKIFRDTLSTLFVTDPENTVDVYGDLDGIAIGLEIVHTLYSSTTKARDLELTHYVLGIAYLHKRLLQDKSMLKQISDAIDLGNEKVEQFGLSHDNTIAYLADIYARTISTMTPRIVVSGEQGYLQIESNASRVRTLLLALMRSCFLWQQNGGRRWHLIFKRGKIVKTASHLYSQVSPPDHSALLEND